jgi:hypothetical protein
MFGVELEQPCSTKWMEAAWMVGGPSIHPSIHPTQGIIYSPPTQCPERFLGTTGRDPSVSQVQPVVTRRYLPVVSLLSRGINPTFPQKQSAIPRAVLNLKRFHL